MLSCGYPDFFTGKGPDAEVSYSDQSLALLICSQGHKDHLQVGFQWNSVYLCSKGFMHTFILSVLRQVPSNLSFAANNPGESTSALIETSFGPDVAVTSVHKQK